MIEYWEQPKFLNWLKGKDILCTFFIEKDSDEAFIYLLDKSEIKFYHSQEGPEDVKITCVTGDPNKIYGKIIDFIMLRMNGPESPPSVDTSHTYTKYILITEHGRLEMTWAGTSNGYFDENVDIDYNGNYESESTKNELLRLNVDNSIRTFNNIVPLGLNSFNCGFTQ